jgi:hypothetical protein
MIAAALFTCGISLALLLFILIATWPFLIVVLSLEKVRPSEAPVRAFRLIKARLWQVIGLTIAVLAIGIALNLFIALLFSATTGFVDAINMSLQIAVNVLVAPILPIGYTLLYYDARIRSERLDAALQLSPTARPGDIVPEATSALVSRDDWMNIAIAVMAIFVILLVYVVLATVAAG